MIRRALAWVVFRWTDHVWLRAMRRQELAARRAALATDRRMRKRGTR